jgi:hypothetical protein
MPEGREIETVWRNAAEAEKRSRTLFAQRRLKPSDVLPELERNLAAIGDSQEVRRFADRALARLGAPLEAMKQGWKAPLNGLPEELRERLAAEGFDGTVRIDFQYPARGRCRPVLRSHPLITTLAEALLERSLGDGAAAQGEADRARLGRVGCWISGAVEARTVLLLLRLRHQIATQAAGRTHTLLVEEAGALAWGGGGQVIEDAAALALLAAAPAGDPPATVRERAIAQAIAMAAERAANLSAFAARHAETLLVDHRRVREAALARGSYAVRALLPPDLVGAFVLLPKVD